MQPLQVHKQRGVSSHRRHEHVIRTEGSNAACIRSAFERRASLRALVLTHVNVQFDATAVKNLLHVAQSTSARRVRIEFHLDKPKTTPLNSCSGVTGNQSN